MDADAAWAMWIGELPGDADRDSIEQAVRDAARDAAARWVGVTLNEATYFAHVARHVGGADDPLEELHGRHLRDLWLSCAVLTGSDEAYAAFDREFGAMMLRAAARACPDDAMAQDVCQRLRERLLLARETGPGALSTYAGRSALGSWLKIVTLRDAARAAKGQERTGEGDVFLAAEADGSPELVAMKREHAALFEAAFVEAMESLTSAERAALRFHLVEGLTIDEIAALESIHRSTAARRIAAARTRIHDGVRARLRVELGLTRAELESLIRIVRSQLDFSVRRHLRTRDPKAPPEG